ncbi:MAG: prepilin-type N-terminal cleavage/methylation domain-containing protein [Acidobacteriia bacterium]|nr:prepilin-type N-terminal cleavage/methylation domain-containing protein [Terriglobia bacterium]
MVDRDQGFTISELLIAILIMGIVAAFAIPQAYSALKAYRLHADAASIAGQLNVTRFRATSQFAPYRLNLISTTTPSTFTMERLNGNATSNNDSNCSSSTNSAYFPYSTASIEGGTQYLSSEDTFTTTNPGGSSNYPGTVTGGTPPTKVYFNTRGMPVNCDGTPIANGGVVVYVKNRDNLTDAVVVSVGGRIAQYQWSSTQNKWISR